MEARRLAEGERDAFVHVPPFDRARARVVVVPWLAPGTAGMTLGRWILLRRGHEHDRRLLAHEIVHVRQWRERGVIRFLATYLTEYLRGRRRGLRHWEAYRAISFETEARALADTLVTDPSGGPGAGPSGGLGAGPSGGLGAGLPGGPGGG